MKIKERLEELVEKYNLNIKKYDTILHKYYSEEIRKKFDEIPNDRKSAIWGMGEHTRELIHIFKADLDKKNILYIVDKDEEKEGMDYHGYKVVSPERAYQEVEYIIVSSFANMYSIKKQVEENSDIKCVTFHERHLNPFFLFAYSKGYPRMRRNLLISKLKKMYVKTPVSEEKPLILREIICLYLDMKDFLSVKEWVQKYISKKYENHEALYEFSRELDDLLEYVKKEMLSCKNENTILFWYDGLKYKNVDKIEFLKGIKEKGCFFENAFSTSTHTYPIGKNWFEGEYLLQTSQNMKSYDECDFKNTRFLKELKKRDVMFFANYLGSFMCEESLKNLKQNKEGVTVSSDYGKSDNDGDVPTITECFWFFFCFCLENKDKPSFSLMQFLETHGDYHCGEHEKEIDLLEYLIPPRGDNDIIKQMRDRKNEVANRQEGESLRYVSKQMKYYSEFLPRHYKKIHMSDHGFEACENGRMTLLSIDEGNIHVPIIVEDCKGIPQTVKGMFSHIDIGRLVLGVIDGEDVRSLANRDYVFVEREAIRSERFYIFFEGPRSLFGEVTAVRGHNDWYILCEDGTQYYYVLPDEDTNLMEEQEYEGRIRQLKEKLEEHVASTRCLL